VSSVRSSGLRSPACGPSGFKLLSQFVLLHNITEEVFHHCSSVTSPIYSPLVCFFGWI
jgi:hypothetical protein